ncbi:hypothetical protein [Gynuella sunshinyii]|uniref:Uncharacterized protein n=1 Tax=Gynuella sunshinyii YC6258 TaxID=1445510 RepID=A0A0C5V242_9GAMM|nr:hypothetical protein [Gynuella sunshinyii]AJQ93605.1 hypothetical Protein YC6258_01557 [Gynuella sunshinyii YC6258]
MNTLILHTEHCLNRLLELEQQVEESRLFNVGYIIPQVTLLENQWRDEGRSGDLQNFLADLKQMVNAHGRQDNLDDQDLTVNAEILALL